MLHIFDLMDAAELERYVREKYISKVASPDGRHTLLNYTEKATFERVWTPETRQCRGLIVNAIGEVVCLCPQKFFNAFEPGIPEVTAEALAARGDGYEVTDKLDGSQVLVWYDDEAGRWRCTTRGSFTSAQAQAAQAWLEARTDWSLWPTPATYFGRRFTFVGEWCAPDNRVVLKYDQPELRLLAVRAWGSDLDGAGHDLPHWGVRSWARELGLPYVPLRSHTLTELLARQSSDTGIEGWVLRWPDGFRVKVKTADYIRLHKALSGFSPKQVYEAALASQREPAVLDAYLAGLPEEIRPDALRYLSAMVAAVDERRMALQATYEQIQRLLAHSRGEFARTVCAHFPPADRPALFALADGKPVAPLLWKQLDVRALLGAEAEMPVAVEEA